MEGRPNRSPDLWIAIGAAGAAALLPISLFFNWYEFSGEEGASASLSGWEALETSDALLFLIGVAAIAAALRYIRGSTPVLSGLPLLALGGSAVVIVLSLFIWDIPFAEVANAEGTTVNTEIQVGGWLALIAAVGLLIAALLNATVRSMASRRS